MEEKKKMGKGKTAQEGEFCFGFSKSYHQYFILENPPLNKDIFTIIMGFFPLKYSEIDKDGPSLLQIFACSLNKLKMCPTTEEQGSTSSNRAF